MVNQFLVEFDTHDGGSVTRKRFATGVGFQTKKSETPSLATYAAQVVDAGSINSFLFRSFATRGTSVSGFGRIRLNNARRDLDGLFDLGVDGREILVRENKGVNFPADFPVRFSGTVKTIAFTDLTVEVNVANKVAAFADLPFQTFKYLGDNAGGSDLEGTPDDIGGLPKPRLRGVALNFEPILVNESTRIYQISSDEIESVDTVYDGRAALTLGVVRATLALFLSNTPAAGDFDVYEGDNGQAVGTNERGAFIKLGSDPAFRLTCDATEGATGAARTFAQIAKRIIEDKGFTVDATSVTDLDTANNAEVQHWQGAKEIKVGKIMDDLAVSISAFFTDDITLVSDFVLGRLEIPVAIDSVKTFANNQLINQSRGEKIKIVRSNDNDKGIPVNRVNLGYAENYTVMNLDELTGVGKTLAEAAEIGLPFRTTDDEDATVLTKHLNSPELNINTKLVLKADADTQATYFLDLYKTERRFIEFRVPIDLGESVNMNDVVTVDGKVYLIIGKRIRFPRSGSSSETSVAITFQGWGGITV